MSTLRDRARAGLVIGRDVLRSMLTRFVFSLPRLSTERRMALQVAGYRLTQVSRPAKVDFGVNEEGLPFARDSEDAERFQLAFAVPQRAPRYMVGVKNRLQMLYASYLFEDSARHRARGAFIVDVGANVGEFSLAALRYGAKGALCFEPDPKAVHALRANVGKYGSVGVHEVALSQRADSMRFFQATASADSSLVPPPKSDQSLVVKTRRLDDYLQVLPEGRLLLKIDAEGAEPEVLRGAEKTFRDRDVVTVIDVGKERQGESTAHACRAILEQAGFTVVLDSERKYLLAH